MKLNVRNPRGQWLIERDGLGWSADGGLWIENAGDERRVRRILGRPLKG